MSNMFDISSLTDVQRPMGVPSVDEFLANLQQTQPQMLQGQLPDDSLHTERANTMPQVPQGGGLSELIQQIMPIIQQQGEQKRQMLDQYQETPQQRNFRLQEARSPWNNGFFGSKEEQAERRASALAENQRMLQRPAGGYQLPQVPQQQQAAPAPQVQQLAATPIDPAAKYRAELDAKYPFKGVQNMPELNQAEAGLNVANVQMDQVQKMNPNLGSEMDQLLAFIENTAASSRAQSAADAQEIAELNQFIAEMNAKAPMLDKMILDGQRPLSAQDRYTAFKTPEYQSELDTQADYYNLDLNNPRYGEVDRQGLIPKTVGGVQDFITGTGNLVGGLKYPLQGAANIAGSAMDELGPMIMEMLMGPQKPIQDSTNRVMSPYELPTRSY